MTSSQVLNCYLKIEVGTYHQVSWHFLVENGAIFRRWKIQVFKTTTRKVNKRFKSPIFNYFQSNEIEMI